MTYTPYTAYASDDAGTGFSLTWNDTLKYFATIHSPTVLASPTLANFTALGAVWKKFIGDDGQGTQGNPGATYYPYTAYATSDAGAGFSLTWNDTLKYTATVHSATIIPSPSLTDFQTLGAVWKKFIGDKGDPGDDADATAAIAAHNTDTDAHADKFAGKASADLSVYTAETNLTDSMLLFLRNSTVNNKITLGTLKAFFANAVGTVKFEVVATLPETGESNIIYLVPKSGTPPDGDVKDEYIYLNGAWELIGSTSVDLSAYYTSAQTDTLLNGKSDTGHTHNYDTEYSALNHTHDYSTTYAALGHTHSNYALTTHTHDYTAVFAPIDHSHSGYSLTTHNHDSAYAAISHTHSGYALSTHNHDGTYVPVTTGYSLVADTEITRLASVSNYDDTAITAALSGKADISALSDYSLTTHNHDGVYAAISHTHDYTSVFSAIGHNHDADYVAKITGKGLSTEDYTSAEKTKLSGIEAGAEVNVNADWNATSGDAQILNKPTIPDAQIQADWNQATDTAKDYIKNKPTIPTNSSFTLAGLSEKSYASLTDKPTIPAAQVQSDWNATSGMGQILNKPTIPSKTSDLTNDSDFTTSSAVSSGYVAKDGSKVLSDNNYDSTSKTKLDGLANITTIGANLTLTDGTLAASASGGGVPSGCVLPFAGAGDVPDGFLLCNGAAVNRTTYANLFSAIGTTYGAGDESTTFNLPDYRGAFLRGYDGTRSTAIGTAQADGLPNIVGDAQYLGGVSGSTYPIATGQSISGALKRSGASSTNVANFGGNCVNTTVGRGLGFDASLSNSIYGNSSYVTPYNYAVQFIIKY